MQARSATMFVGLPEAALRAASKPRRKFRPVAVIALVLAGALIFGAVHAFTSVVTATTPAHDTPRYFIVMPHPASEENRRVAQWLSSRLDCPVVEDASVHEVGVRGSK